MSWLNGFSIGKGVPQPKPRPAAESTARKGRRRKLVEVPCCEVCDCHFLTVRTSKSDTDVHLECSTCGYVWRDTTREVINRPRARRVVKPQRQG